MKILGGQWQGRTIQVPKGIRPMTEMVKQALFQVLGNLENLRTLDLFAGSGQLGLEALSRGTAFAAFVEINKQNAECVRKNLKTFDVSAESARVLVQDALYYMESTRSAFDLIFVDPPYEKGYVSPCFKTLAGPGTLLAPGGRLVLRHTKHEPLEPAENAKLDPEFSRRYGDDVLTIWRNRA